jgi:hypothetical protein
MRRRGHNIMNDENDKEAEQERAREELAECDEPRSVIVETPLSTGSGPLSEKRAAAERRASLRGQPQPKKAVVADKRSNDESDEEEEPTS